MSEDRIQRQIEFIVDQQAKFATDIAELKQRQDKQAENIDKLTANITSLADAILSLTNIVSEHGDQIAALAQQGKETDARLNTLINIVERHISNPNAHREGE